MTVDQRVLEKLKNEAKTNPASNAVFHVWALRKRARGQVNLNSLYNKMKKEGFTHNKKEYASLLNLLASLDIGTLDLNIRGEIRALKNVKIKLQSLGNAVVGEGTLSNFRSRNKFVPITIEKPDVIKVLKEMPDAVNIEVLIGGKTITIPIPRDFDSKDITHLIDKLRS